MDYSLWGCKEADTTERLSRHNCTNRSKATHAKQAHELQNSVIGTQSAQLSAGVGLGREASP